jgi:hypothetical protein
MRIASPGARVGQAWDNVGTTNGTPPHSPPPSVGRRKKGSQGVRNQSEVEGVMGEI